MLKVSGITLHCIKAEGGRVQLQEAHRTKDLKKSCDKVIYNYVSWVACEQFILENHQTTLQD
jgi:hypothetical protein